MCRISRYGCLPARVFVLRLNIITLCLFIFEGVVFETKQFFRGTLFYRMLMLKIKYSSDLVFICGDT